MDYTKINVTEAPDSEERQNRYQIVIILMTTLGVLALILLLFLAMKIKVKRRTENSNKANLQHAESDPVKISVSQNDKKSEGIIYTFVQHPPNIKTQDERKDAQKDLQGSDSITYSPVMFK
nr:PREDICTED: uncharacterized protein LOC106704582 [Latimeria chalumnae]|eukprot:XP_014347389.1 PREDICTED: uncharacterized protein LOC106704582 [Latimeria chalumnae]